VLFQHPSSLLPVQQCFQYFLKACQNDSSYIHSEEGKKKIAMNLSTVTHAELTKRCESIFISAEKRYLVAMVGLNNNGHADYGTRRVITGVYLTKEYRLKGLRFTGHSQVRKSLCFSIISSSRSLLQPLSNYLKTHP
jgi:hypothetical protein